MKIEGLWTALVTPFTENLEVDFDSLKKLVENQIEGGVNGILLIGTSGEAPTLNKDEQAKIISFVKKEVNGRVSLMVGTGSYATKATIENTKVAKELGADSALVVAPFYNKPTQRGIIKHFEEVSKNVDLPICVYNIKGRTAINIETETLKEIAKIDNVVSVKESSGDLNQISDVIYEIQNKRDDFTVLSGDDGITMPLMALGGKGVISVASNVIPKEIAKLLSFCINNDFESARDVNFNLKKFLEVLFIESNPAPVKYVLSKLGLANDILRLPLLSISEASRKEVDKVFDSLEV